jgi:putative flippase GtrA
VPVRPSSVDALSTDSSRPASAHSLGELLLAMERRLPLPPICWRIARFLSVGLVGLGVDAGLFASLFAEGAGAPVGRAVSLALATIVTWWLNRQVTFAPSGRSALNEALRYAMVAVLAQGFNYVSFLFLLQITQTSRPLLCLVASAVMTAAFSFTGQSLFAFSRSRHVRTDLER